jgi:hypothetical protein
MTSSEVQVDVVLIKTSPMMQATVSASRCYNRFCEADFKRTTFPPDFQETVMIYGSGCETSSTDWLVMLPRNLYLYQSARSN